MPVSGTVVFYRAGDKACCSFLAPAADVGTVREQRMVTSTSLATLRMEEEKRPAMRSYLPTPQIDGRKVRHKIVIT